MLRPVDRRIPVTAGPRLLEMAGPERVAVLLQAPNVKVILRHRRTIVELQVMDYGDSSRIPPRHGRPLQLSTDSESYDNPPRVWRFKRSYD